MEKMEKAPFLATRDEGAPTHDETSHSTGDACSRWRSKRYLFLESLVIASAVATIVIFVVYGGQRIPAQKSTSALASLPAAMNATLGFGAILLLSLPDRTDRQDAMSLISSNSGIEITKTIYSVMGETVSSKARPIGSDHISPKYLGSWRSHMNALKYVVDNKIETALIFEDDVDWSVFSPSSPLTPVFDTLSRDMRIKTQLAALSRGLAASPLGDKSPSAIPVSAKHPYGMDWDIMHLGPGYSFLPPHEPYRSLHSTYEDPDRTQNLTCPENYWHENMYCWGPTLDYYHTNNDSRVILPSYHVAGLPAIAVTYTGAQRMLYHLTWVGLMKSLDMSIMDLIMGGKLNGWTVIPPFFTQFKVGGDQDSDLNSVQTVFDKVRSNLKGISPGIENTARQALCQTFESESPTRWTKQYWADRGMIESPAPTKNPPVDAKARIDEEDET